MNVQNLSRFARGFGAASAFVGLVGLCSGAQATPGAIVTKHYTYNVPTGTTDLFLHQPCPASRPRAISGGFLPNAAAKVGLQVLGNGPRLDITPVSFNEWSWIFDWSGAGAPAGSVIKIALYCDSP
jgi:hypothetical protein